jgi:hypothetical protein
MTKTSLSKVALYVMILFSLFFIRNNRIWHSGVIQWDVISYYAYLPAAFIYNDMHLEYIHNPDFKGTVWPEQAENGNKVIKTTMGLAILYAPFFFIAHGIALASSEYSPDGYSAIYSLLLILSNLFYTMVGFVFLRKLLLKYYTDNITAIVMLLIFFSTNLFYYTFYNVMSHSYLFALITLFIYFTIKWHETPSYKNSLIIGLLVGFIFLIRPIDILVVFLFIFYGCYNLDTLKSNVNTFLNQYKKIIVIAFSALAVFSIQMLYWKAITGNWFFWSYTGESFFWSKPHIIEGLFGFRKGLFIYVPIMALAFIGLCLIHYIEKKWQFAFVLFTFTFTYITLSWWSWWYGGGFSIRPFVDIYGVMAIGLGATITQAFKIKYEQIRTIVISLIALVGMYGTFTLVQYHFGATHWDSMTKDSWKASFGEIHWHPSFSENLKSPDYDKAKNTGEE